MENILFFLLKLGNSFLSSHHPPPPPPPVFLHLFSQKKKPEKLLSRPELLSRHATASPTTSHLSLPPVPFRTRRLFTRFRSNFHPKNVLKKILAFFSPLVRENKGRKNGARATVFFHFFLVQRAVSHNNKMFSAFAGVTFRQPLSSFLSSFWSIGFWRFDHRQNRSGRRPFSRKKRKGKRKGTFSSFGPTNWNKKVACTGCCTRAFPNNKKKQRGQKTTKTFFAPYFLPSSFAIILC